MYHLIYLSSAVNLFDRQELHDLLVRSRRNNERNGITGILVYKDGNFLQAIEGEERAVKALFDKITLDPRHRGVLTLFNETIPSREFPDWSMAFRDGANSPEIASGFNTLLSKSETADISDYPAKVRAFLRHVVS